MAENIPNLFVRFYSNPEFALDCLENKQLTLIHTSKFNDPFDPILDFVLQCDWNYDEFVNWVQSNKRALNSQDIENNRTGWLSAKRKLEDLYTRYRSTMFAACFCTEYTRDDGKKLAPQHNLYMWGHYANGHRGVAIELKKDFFISAGGGLRIDRVEYRDKLPAITNEELYEFVFNHNVSFINAKHEQALRTKTKNWEPEQEWRFKVTNPETKLPWVKEPLHEDSIKSVYLGCQINKEIADKIIVQTKAFHPNASVYSAKKDLKNLEVIFDIM